MTLSLEQAMQDAIAHHRAGRLDEAERLYRAALAARPNHAEAWHNLGVVAVQRGNVAAGLPHFERALEQDKQTPLYWISQARALLALGRSDEARKVLTAARSHGVAGPAYDALAAQAGLASGGGDPFAAALSQHQAGRLAEA